MSKLPNELDTINVIVMENGSLEKIRSFPKTEDGIREAEIAFHDEIVEWHKDQGKDAPLEEDIEAAIENGYFDYTSDPHEPSDLDVFLSHSD